jgi:predicted amidophosphoribosyltransferase
LPHKPDSDACGNPHCNFDHRHFDRNYSIAMRSGALQDAISLYKYESRKSWATIFARVLVGKLESERAVFRTFDLIVASPTFTGKGAGRNWDHTRLVLERAAQVAPEWPFDLEEPAAIIKTAATEQMMGKNWKQRRVVAEGSLRDSLRVPAPTRIRGKRILVYDDVFTDGQTLNEVARALTHSGAKQVCGITLARQPWRKV